MLAAVIAALITATLAPTQALAATYEVHMCEEDVREAVPNTNWSLLGPAARFRLNTDCEASPTGLTSSGQVPPGAEGALQLSVPRPLMITEMKYRQLIRAPAAMHPPNAWWWDFEQRMMPERGANHMVGVCPGRDNWCDERYGGATIRDKRFSAFEWLLRCSAQSTAPCSDGEVQVLEARLKIDDPAPPNLVGQPSGAVLAGASNVNGTQTVVFEATDEGAGVYRAVLEIDGAIAAESGFNHENAACIAPFRVAQPCPRRVVGSLAVDTSRYVDGPHVARLSVYDATGANVAIYGPVAFTTRNATLDSYCGEVDAQRFQLHVPRSKLPFGRRWRFRARIDRGQGWSVVLLSGGSHVSSVATGTVGRNGRYEVRIPPGPSRTLRLAVRPQGSTAKYICSGPRRLRVKAKLALRVTPQRTTNGRSVRIVGRLSGERRGRKAVVIQARAVGNARWATVRVLRTRQDGRFRMRYRFHSTVGRVTYIFRAQVRSERGYPYATGTSRGRSVTVVG
jgi:hypothetical protein